MHAQYSIKIVEHRIFSFMILVLAGKCSVRFGGMIKCPWHVKLVLYLLSNQ